MPETTIIDLGGRIEALPKLSAEWWEETSKFAVIRGTTAKDPKEFAVRLDLDKRAFLDLASDTETTELLRGNAGAVADLVWAVRRKRASDPGSAR